MSSDQARLPYRGPEVVSVGDVETWTTGLTSPVRDNPNSAALTYYDAAAGEAPELGEEEGEEEEGEEEEGEEEGDAEPE